MTAPITSLRIDETVKNEAKPILEELGLNLSSSVNIFLRAVVRTGGIPFDMRIPDATKAPAIDFAAEYIAPILSPRNKVNRPGATPRRTRERLCKLSESINRDRRTIV